MQEYNVIIGTHYDDDKAICNLVENHCKILNISFDRKRIENIVDSFLSGNDPSKICFLLIDGSSTIKGYLLAMLSEQLVSGEKIAQEIGFYCESPGKGPLLIRAYEDLMRELKVQTLTLSSHGQTD